MSGASKVKIPGKGPKFDYEIGVPGKSAKGSFPFDGKGAPVSGKGAPALPKKGVGSLTREGTSGFSVGLGKSVLHLNITGEFKATVVSSSMILDGLDSLVKTLFGFSPIDEWVVKPFSGDWDALETGAQVWNGTSGAFDTIKNDFSRLPSQTSEVWQGEAAIAFGEQQEKTAAALEALPQAATQIADGLQRVSQLAQTAGQIIRSILDAVCDWLIRLSGEVSIPVAGWIAGAVDVTVMVAKAAMFCKQAIDTINNIMMAIADFAGTTQTMKLEASRTSA